MRVLILYDPEISMPRVSMTAESPSEEQELQLLAAFEDVRFSWEIDEREVPDGR